MKQVVSTLFAYKVFSLYISIVYEMWGVFIELFFKCLEFWRPITERLKIRKERKEGLKPHVKKNWHAVDTESRTLIRAAKTWAPINPRYMYISDAYREGKNGKRRQALLVRTHTRGYMHGLIHGRYIKNAGFAINRWEICLIIFEDECKEPVNMTPTFRQIKENRIPDETKRELQNLLTEIEKKVGTPIELNHADI